MTVPAVVSMINANKQLVGIQALGLSAPDEAAYKVLLAAAYTQAIADYTGNALNPFLAPILQWELVQLQSLTTTQLAALPVRGA